MNETSDIELPEVSDEMVDIFARKFWAIPREQLTPGSQDAARAALAPMLAEHERHLRAEVNGLRRENERLREENIRRGLAAEKDVCSGCMQREQQRDAAWDTSRQNGEKYEQAKRAWRREQDRAVQAEFELSRIVTESGAERDELAEARAVIARVQALPGRSSMGRVNDYVPLADVRAALHAPHSPAEPVSPVSTPTEAHGETGEAQEG